MAGFNPLLILLFQLHPQKIETILQDTHLFILL